MSLRVNCFGVGLVLADAEHVHVDRQLVDAPLVEHAVVAEAIDEARGRADRDTPRRPAPRGSTAPGRSLRRPRPPSCRTRGTRAARHRFPAACSDPPPLIWPRSSTISSMRLSSFAAVDRIDHVAHQRLRLALARGSAIARSIGSPASCSTMRPCGSSTSAACCGTIGMRALQRADHDGEQHQQHDEVQHLAQAVERAPGEVKEREQCGA